MLEAGPLAQALLFLLTPRNWCQARCSAAVDDGTSDSKMPLGKTRQDLWVYWKWIFSDVTENRRGREGGVVFPVMSRGRNQRWVPQDVPMWLAGPGVALTSESLSRASTVGGHVNVPMRPASKRFAEESSKVVVWGPYSFSPCSSSPVLVRS